MTTAVAAAPEKKKAPVRRLNAAQRAEAIALWQSGTVTLDDLSKRFKKDRSTFTRLFAEEKIEKGSSATETEKRVSAAVESEIVDDAILNARRVRDVKDRHFTYVTMISKLAWNIVREGISEKRNPATYASDMKTLEMTMRVFRMTREELYTLLGVREDDMGDDDEMPELVIQELTAKDIQELHQRSLMSDDELGLNESLGDEELLQPDHEDDDENERIEVES